MSSNRRGAWSILQKLFANPWAMWVVLTLLGALAALLVLHGKPLSIHRIAVGTIFGFSLGAAYVVETRCKCAIIWNRTICASIGAIAGLVIAWLLSLTFRETGLSVGVGLVLGATSRNWIHRVSLP